jgi:hypothetical protein
MPEVVNSQIRYSLPNATKQWEVPFGFICICLFMPIAPPEIFFAGFQPLLMLSHVFIVAIYRENIYQTHLRF